MRHVLKESVLQEPHAVSKVGVQRFETRFPSVDINIIFVTHDGFGSREVLKLIFGMRACFLNQYVVSQHAKHNEGIWKANIGI